MRQKSFTDIPPISPSPSILIILMGSLGDVARGLCLVNHIKTNLPKSRITWLVGDSSQATMAAALTEEFQTPAVIDLVGQTSLAQLAALLKAAAVGVGPDSGPGHVAAAVKTPFVTFFGPTSPQRTAPFGNHHLVVKAGLSCAPGYKKRYADRNKQCMNSIHSDAVMEKVSLALAEYANY